MVLLKATPNAIEPISFKVPRKSDLFQDDLFPATAGEEPLLLLTNGLVAKMHPQNLFLSRLDMFLPKIRHLSLKKLRKSKKKS